MANEEAGMSGRGRGSAAIRDWRKGAFAPRYILAGLIALICVACIPSVASADVDSVGGLEKVAPTLKSSPHELTPLAGGAGLYQCSSAHAYADIHSEPWGFVIGQCKSGWKFEVLEHTGVNSKTKTSSYGGYLEGAFDACGWIESDEGPEQINEKVPSHCPGLNQKESTVGSFYEKYNGQPEPTGDGYYIVNKVPCKEYANFRPWSKESVEKEEVRTVPAYALGGEHHFEHEPALKWRYVTEYASTDGSGKYVMVRDTRVNGGEGNWVFVPLSCLRANASELPTGEGEYVPSPPTVTTDGPSGVATPNATLNAEVNPNSVDTKYFFEYGTTENYGSYTTTEDAGAGTSIVHVKAPIGGLAPGTTYYFRIVASSATGESVGGPVAFTTQPPPTVSTSAATSVSEELATLNGTVNGNGLNTTYHFEYGETTAYGSSTSLIEGGSGSSNPSVSVTELQPSATYHYRIVATSSAGSSDGGDQVFKTSSAPALAIDAFGQRWYSFEGANNSLGMYWESTNGEVHGPKTIGGTGSTYSRPALVVEKEDQRWYSMEGSTHTLDMYWEGTNGEAHGPKTIGGTNSTYSAPSLAIESLGQRWYSMEGSNHTLDMYWEGTNGEAHGPKTIGGTNSTYSAPSLVIESLGQRWYAAEGSNHTLDMYWEGTNGEAHGPKEIAGADSTYSPPAFAIDKSNQRWYAVQGPSNSLDMYWEGTNGEVHGPRTLAGSASTYSAPALVIDSLGQRWYAAEGSNNSLEMYWEGTNGEAHGPKEVGKTGSTYSTPALAVEKEDQRWYSMEGSNASLAMYWEGTNGEAHGPRELGPAGTIW
jgi:hypothetical protein